MTARSSIKAIHHFVVNNAYAFWSLVVVCFLPALLSVSRLALVPSPIPEMTTLVGLIVLQVYKVPDRPRPCLLCIAVAVPLFLVLFFGGSNLWAFVAFMGVVVPAARFYDLLVVAVEEPKEAFTGCD